MTSSEFKISAEHLMETRRSLPKQVRLRRRAEGATASLVSTILIFAPLILGTAAVLVGAIMHVYEGKWIVFLALVPIGAMSYFIIRALFPLQAQRRSLAEARLAAAPWLGSPTTITISDDAVRIERAVLTTVVPRSAILGYDEGPLLARLSTIDDEFYADVITLQRDGLLEPLRAWVKTASNAA